MKPKHWLDTAVGIFGPLSFLSLIGFFLAGHDIWHDYASPEVWARAGQALPTWYSPGNRTPLEWGMMQVGFLIVLAFHVLLFARFVFNARVSARVP
jgi:hypothetical protein